jgi:hypothetical protein
MSPPGLAKQTMMSKNSGSESKLQEIEMGAHNRIVDVRYDRRLANLHLTYESGATDEVTLLRFGSVPFEFAEDMERKLKRFEIAPDGKSVYFPDMGITYSEEELDDSLPSDRD